MHREYHRWHSPRLGRDMELLVFGHAGAKVLAFPTRDGRFYQYENLRMLEVLADRIHAGQFRLWCVDSLDWETFYCRWCHPADRVRRRIAYEEYLLNEVMPLMQTGNAHSCTIARGLSLGGRASVGELLIGLRPPPRSETRPSVPTCRAARPIRH